MTALLIRDKHKPKLKPEHAPLLHCVPRASLSPSLSAQALGNKRLSTAPSHYCAAGTGWTLGATTDALSFCRSASWSATWKKIAWVVLAPTTLPTWASINSRDGTTWDQVFQQSFLFNLYLGHPYLRSSCFRNHQSEQEVFLNLTMRYLLSFWVLGSHFFKILN